MCNCKKKNPRDMDKLNSNFTYSLISQMTRKEVRIFIDCADSGFVLKIQLLWWNFRFVQERLNFGLKKIRTEIKMCFSTIIILKLNTMVLNAEPSTGTTPPILLSFPHELKNDGNATT